MSNRWLALLVVACFGLLEPRPAVAAPTEAQYTLTRIAVPGALATRATAINQRGQVAGYAALSDGTQVAYVYTEGVFTYPGTLGARYMWVRDINDAGDIVGSYTLPGDDVDRDRAFAWIDGVTTDLGPLLGGETLATVIDKRGIVYGISDGQPFAWRNGRVRDLGGWDGYDVTVIQRVNDHGIAVGHAVHYGFMTIAFMADRWSRTVLPTLGGESAGANGINSQGAVCGWAEVPKGKYHAFRYQDGVMTDLGVLTGGVHSEAMAINSAGDVVGVSSASRGEHAFIVRGGGSQMEDLNTLADIKGQGWKLLNALDINDRGEIVGNGNQGAFLLTPIAGAKRASKP